MSFAAPVANGKFSFSVDSFYVESSGQNLHRRATVPELQTLFQPASTGANASPDPVGHWYEAQLLHYGLAPSKNKAVAKMRLLDAVRGGGLAVPKDVVKIETELKKEWKKKDKEAKTGTGRAGETKKVTATAKKSDDGAGAGANKRKRNGDGGEETAAQAPKATAKKTKAADSTSTAAKKTAETNKKPQAVKPASTKTEAKPDSKAKTTAAAKNSEAQKDPEPTPKRQFAKGGGRGASTASSRNDPPAPEPEPAQPPRLKQTARCSRGASTASSRNNPPAPEPEPAPLFRTKQTARRSGGFVSGRRPTDPAIRNERQTPPPAYSEYPSDAYEADPTDIDHPSDDWSSDGGPNDDDSSTPLPPLGLVNGEYEIYSSDLNEWSEFPEEDFNLILGLAGNSMWGAYDFGMFHGIMHLQERPWSSSHKEIPFEWRGCERGEGQMSFGSGCTGWIRFLGDGRIDGELHCYGKGRFHGQRISGDETQPPRDVRSMREEWNGYNQREYDNENRRRWGGW